MEQGKKKILWFSGDQITLMDQLKEKTGHSNSQIVRDAMVLYSKYLKSVKK